jgi:adenine-specific DNA-methyltransferase
MTKKTRLELTWVGKENRPQLEPRILLEDPTLSYHAPHRVTDDDQFDNLLIQGDNLLALKALEADYTGKVKCVFIDPPYNTGSAFAHYDDGVEHSLWLSLMRDRLELLYRLLSPDGSIWISIDDNEVHYLKVMCDEIFGRANFVTSFIWRKVDSPNDNKVPITPNHEYILCIARDKQFFNPKKMGDESILKAYRRDELTGELYRDRLLKKNGKSSLRSDRPSMWFPIPTPDGGKVYPIHDDGQEACWAVGEKKVRELLETDGIVWKKRFVTGIETWVPYTREYPPTDPARPYPTIWDDLTTMRQAKAHQKVLLPGVEPFSTPKPEELINRILELATDPGDLVLDSFAGSGTTGAVAHKMGRRWIMVELHKQAQTHIVPRLRKVMDGQDPGGITKTIEWTGGGGFRFYTLAPSLLTKDRWDNWVINKEYNPEMLTEALCKLHGFRYSPNPEVFWQQGHSTETDYLYVTTATLTHAQLEKLSEEVGPDRTLLVLCPAFKGSAPFANLTVKKIPKHVLHRCEWGHDDYSLRVENLPQAPPQPGQQVLAF